MPIALKIFRGDGASILHAMRREILVLQQHLRHPNVVEMYGIFEEVPGKHNYMLAMELMTGGSLRAMLDSATSKPWRRRLAWLLDVAKGMCWLAGLLPNPIVHRDLKAQNVLLGPDARVAKVADFGLAKVTPLVDRVTVVNGWLDL